MEEGRTGWHGGRWRGAVTWLEGSEAGTHGGGSAGDLDRQGYRTAAWAGIGPPAVGADPCAVSTVGPDRSIAPPVVSSPTLTG